MRKTKFIISDFYCTQCGERGIEIPRKVNKQKEPGHLKKIYCLKCKKETNHVEIKQIGKYTLEDFKEEFNLGRFVNGNRIPVSELLSCEKENCKYNKSGKCWNSNNSYNCSHRCILENPNDETKNLLNHNF